MATDVATVAVRGAWFERLWKEGRSGLLAPSAARPSGQILCLFRDEHGVRGAEPVPPPHKRCGVAIEGKA